MTTGGLEGRPEAGSGSRSGTGPLDGVVVVSLALNVPGPVAAARLRDLGAAVTTVEPPAGDPLSSVAPAWYAELHAGQRVVRLDLKDAAGRQALEPLLAQADLLLTSSRPGALTRLDLGWAEVHARHPRLVQVAIVGEASPHGDRPGHDLTYAASAGLVAPPALPLTLMADLAGAERAVSAALAALYQRERGAGVGATEVALADAIKGFAGPLAHGLTVHDGVLGGGFAGYNLYRSADGWIAVAALEPHFWQRLTTVLGLDPAGAGEHDALQAVFARQTSMSWQEWAREHDLPLVAVDRSAV